MNCTRTIGMLVTASNNPFYAEVVRGVERSCYEQGYSLIYATPKATMSAWILALKPCYKSVSMGCY